VVEDIEPRLFAEGRARCSSGGTGEPQFEHHDDPHRNQRDSRAAPRRADAMTKRDELLADIKQRNAVRAEAKLPQLDEAKELARLLDIASESVAKPLRRSDRALVSRDDRSFALAPIELVVHADADNMLLVVHGGPEEHVGCGPGLSSTGCYRVDDPDQRTDIHLLPLYCL
jgi:hypothetical protein